MRTSLPTRTDLLDDAYAAFLVESEKPYDAATLEHSFEVVSTWPQASRDLLCVESMLAYWLSVPEDDKLGQKIMAWLKAQTEKRLITAVLLKHLLARRSGTSTIEEGRIFIALSKITDIQPLMGIYSQIINDAKPAFSEILATCGCDETLKWHAAPKDRLIVANCQRLPSVITGNRDLWATDFLRHNLLIASKKMPKTHAAMVKILLNETEVVSTPLLQALKDSFRAPLSTTIAQAVVSMELEYNRNPAIVANLTAAAELIVDGVLSLAKSAETDAVKNDLAKLRQLLTDSQCAWIWRIAPSVCQALESPTLIHNFINGNKENRQYASNTLGDVLTRYQVVESLSDAQTVAFAKITLKDEYDHDSGWPLNIGFRKMMGVRGPQFWQELTPLIQTGYGSPSLIYKLLKTLPEVGPVEIAILQQWLEVDPYHKLYKSDPAKDLFREFIIPHELRPGKLLNPDVFYPNMGYQLHTEDLTADGVSRLLPNSSPGWGLHLASVQAKEHRSLLLNCGHKHINVLVFMFNLFKKDINTLEDELAPFLADGQPQSAAFRRAIFDLAWPEKEILEYSVASIPRIMARRLLSLSPERLDWLGDEGQAVISRAFEESWYYLFSNEPHMLLRIHGANTIRQKFFAHIASPEKQTLRGGRFLTERIDDWKLLFDTPEGRKELSDCLFNNFWHFVNIKAAVAWLRHYDLIKEQRFRLLFEQVMDKQDDDSLELLKLLRTKTAE